MLDSSRQKITVQSLLGEFFSPSRIHLISMVSQHTLKSERNTEQSACFLKWRVFI